MSTSESGNSNVKQPIKRLEIPISKFDVATAHHLDLLRMHKNNIKKFRNTKEWNKLQKEQINASRLVKQLEQLVYEIDALRGRVKNDDIEEFDKLTWQSRHSTINAIREYLDMEAESQSLAMIIDNNVDQQNLSIDESTESLSNEEQSQLLKSEETVKAAEELERRNACLNAWNMLQSDLHQLYQLFIDLNQLINDQKDHVNTIEDQVITTDVNVTKGNKNLEQVSKLKTAAYPIAGALIGTCIAGPIGLFAGLKLGGLSAVGGGLLGFASARILRKRHLEKMKKDSHEMNTISTNTINTNQSETPTKELKKQL